MIYKSFSYVKDKPIYTSLRAHTCKYRDLNLMFTHTKEYINSTCQC